MSTHRRTHALMAALVLTMGAAFASPATAQDFDDPVSSLREAEYVAAMAPRLCANSHLKHRLQDTYVQVGDRDNGSEPILNCYERAERQLRANVADLLRALDVACPGADVRLWMTNPETVPTRGCGETYVEPDWGNRPTLMPPLTR